MPGVAALPVVYTPITGQLVIDNFKGTDFPDDTSLKFEAADKEFLKTQNLLYGGCVYTYTAGSRNMLLSFELIVESPMRDALYAKAQAFHAKCLGGGTIIPATDMYKITFTSPQHTLMECFALPSVHQGHEQGKDRKNTEFSFILHGGLDRWIVGNVRSAFTP